MTPDKILGMISACGVSCRLEGETLKLRPRTERGIPPMLLETVKANKPALVAELKARQFRTLERDLTAWARTLEAAEYVRRTDGAHYADTLNKYEIGLLIYMRLCRELEAA